MEFIAELFGILIVLAAFMVVSILAADVAIYLVNTVHHLLGLPAIF